MFSSKHFRKKLKLDLCVWKGIRVYLLHFTIHIKTVIKPWKYVWKNKTWTIFLTLVNSQVVLYIYLYNKIFAIASPQKKKKNQHPVLNLLVCVHFLRLLIRGNNFFFKFSSFSISYYIPTPCNLKEIVYVWMGWGIHRHLYVFACVLKKRKVAKEELQKGSRLSLKEAKV